MACPTTHKKEINRKRRKPGGRRNRGRSRLWRRTCRKQVHESTRTSSCIPHNKQRNLLLPSSYYDYTPTPTTTTTTAKEKKNGGEHLLLFILGGKKNRKGGNVIRTRKDKKEIVLPESWPPTPPLSNYFLLLFNINIIRLYLIMTKWIKWLLIWATYYVWIDLKHMYDQCIYAT